MYYRVSERPRSIARFSAAARDRREHRRADGLHVTRTRCASTAGCGFCSGGANWQPSYTIQEIGWSKARTLVRGPVSECPAPRTSQGSAATGRTRSTTATASASTGVFTEGNLNEYPNSIYYAVVQPHGIYDAAGRRIARLGSAPPVQKLDRVHEATSPATTSGRSTSPPARSARSSCTCGGAPRPEFWWARYDGTKWLNFKITEYARPPRSPGAVGGATLDHENPNIVYLLAGRGGSGRDMTSRSETPDGGETWKHRTLTRAKTDDLRPITPRGLTD